MQCYRKECSNYGKCDKFQIAACLYRETKEQAELKDKIKNWVRCRYIIRSKQKVKARVNISTGELEIDGQVKKWAK